MMDKKISEIKQHKPLYKLLDWIDPNKLDWYKLSESLNPNAISLLEKYPEKIHWFELSRNPNANALLEKYPDKIKWGCLSQNTNPDAIALLEKNLDKLDNYCWEMLSKNLNAIALLEKNLDKLDRKCWSWLSENPNAMHILEKNEHKLDRSSWSFISDNPSMFEIDCKTMKKQMVDKFREELMRFVFHPKRILAWLDAGFEDF